VLEHVACTTVQPASLHPTTPTMATNIIKSMLRFTATTLITLYEN
jgi:hypothetical protein